MNNFEPSNYARRILLVVSGMSPQVLTETLYALTQKRQPAFCPTEVHILTTSTGARNARLTLLQGDAHFLRFCEEYGVDPAILSAENIHAITTSAGAALEDIRSVAENEAAADFITHFIRNMTTEEGSALHVSMAGGRKTMGYYAGYALSLYGREQDRLSHVLVTEGFEGHRDFYYPTLISKAIYRQDKPALDAKDADVSLAEIPFVRLRQDIPEGLIGGTTSFSETIAIAQRSQLPQRLTLDCQSFDFRVEDVSLDNLGAANLAFFVWLLDRQLSGQPAIGTKDLLDDNKPLGEAFLHVCEKLQLGLKKRGQTALSKTISANDGYGINRDSFDYRRTNLNKALRKCLGNVIGERFSLHNFGKKGAASYGFSIDPELIDWLPFNA